MNCNIQLHKVLTQGLCGLCLQTSVSPRNRVGLTYILKYSSIASLEGRGSIKAADRGHPGHMVKKKVYDNVFFTINCMCDDHLQFGNMNLISLTAASTDVLPWSAFCNSDVPYLALRLGGKKWLKKCEEIFVSLTEI